MRAGARRRSPSRRLVLYVGEARKDAAEERRDADYKVAVEKCDALSGAAKDECITRAKAKYGK